MIMTRIVNARKVQRLHPQIFWRPQKAELEKIKTGNIVKMIFCDDLNENTCSKMWTKVIERKGNDLVGLMQNKSMVIPDLDLNDKINFNLDNVVDILRDGLILSEEEVIEVIQNSGAEPWVGDGLHF
jgi:uncharacterized protein YegJ (DUF2314 family)